MLDNSVIDDVMDLVQSDDFYRPAHRKIFKCMMEMRAKGEAIDAVTLRSSLQSKNLIEEIGGAGYLIDLQSSCYTAKAAPEYADVVRKLSIMRRLVGIGSEVMTIGYEAQIDDMDSTLADVMSMTTSLTLAHQSSAIPVGTVLEDVLKQMRSGVKNYFSPPKIPLARFREGDLVVIGAGTSAGKTAITLDWADEWSKSKNITYFEYEMPETDLMARLICKHAGVTMQMIQDGDLTAEQVQRIEDAADQLKHRNLKVAEVWCNANTLMAKIRREVQQGAEIIIVDHLGLIPYNRPKNMTEAKGIGVFITNPLKRLASELGITIILLVQLNREGQREGFPKLYHLRESGEIEQDASVVLMLWSEKSIRDDWASRIKVRENSGIIGESETMDDAFYLVRIGVEKNRNGQLGEAYCKFYGNTFSYVFPEDEEVDLVSPRALFGVE
jgi:replicative DNA helicase